MSISHQAIDLLIGWSFVGVIPLLGFVLIVADLRYSK